jgi:diguanylate cyclase (GGDEF)-like protein
LTNKHIGLRLGIAFAVLIAILMGIGQLGLRRMHEINQTLGDITGRRSVKLQMAREALSLSNRNSRIAMEIVLVENRALVDTLLATRSENSKKIATLMDEIEGGCRPGREKQLLSAVKETRKPYMDSYLRAMHLLLDEGKHDTAEVVMVNEALPALVKYHAAWDEFVEFQTDEVAAAVKQSQVDYGRARLVASLLIVLAVVVATAIAIFATRETTRGIAARIDAQNEVSRLNTNLEARVAQRTHELTEANQRLASDVEERRQAQERIKFLAYYDSLTGLPNRTLLEDRLTKALAGARRRKDKVALLFLDLDRFKMVNDSLGHSVGDLLLQEVAKRLTRGARDLDTVARLGGDEFLVVLTGIREVADAAVAADRVVNSMTAGFTIQGRALDMSCSVGVSIFPDHGKDGETLIKNADAAMYSAKENGRNKFRFFTEHMNTQIVERLTLEKGLRTALDKKELFLVYQPQMDIATRGITGLEALLRWQHPELGLVPPDKFIRIAENSGLIMPIGEWVLRTACLQARKWQDQGLPPVSVAVNVSAVQFRQEDFCELIRRVLDDSGLAPQYLELELTESLLLANADVTLSVVQELKSMGLTLAIDDFGTGYSSFSYLRQFRVSKLKVDRVFVRDVAVNPDDAAITSAIISMAKSLKMKVIAEGVENEAQMSFLRAHHCDEIQGYYFSKPLAVDKVADKLRSAAVQLA